MNVCKRLLNLKLDNVKIAMHCNLRPTDVATVVLRLTCRPKFYEFEVQLTATLLLISYVTL